MSVRKDLAEAVDIARQLADQAPTVFADIRQRAGSISAVDFHRQLADAIDRQLGKVEHVRARLVAPHSLRVHSKDMAVVTSTINAARAAIDHAGKRA